MRFGKKEQKSFWLNFKLLSFIFLASSSWANSANEIKTDNFVLTGLPYDRLVEWGDFANAQKKEIAHQLGFFSNKRWVPPCRIEFSSDFYQTSGAPRWAKAWSQVVLKGNQVQSRSIWVIPQLSKSEMASALSHEVAHLLFREFLEFPQQVPIWLDEGVAIWAQSGERRSYEKIMRKALKKGGAYPLKTFFQFQNYPKQKSLFYAQASSIINYLIQNYGVSEFQRFSRLIRDGETFQEALFLVYQLQISRIEEFEEDWKKSIL